MLVLLAETTVREGCLNRYFFIISDLLPPYVHHKFSVNESSEEIFSHGYFVKLALQFDHLAHIPLIQQLGTRRVILAGQIQETHNLDLLPFLDISLNSDRPPQMDQYSRCLLYTISKFKDLFDF